MVIGRDLHADLRIADPRISRAHLILRFDQGRWLAIDNGSLNGTYVNGYRMPVIDIHDGQSINVGNPQGPRLTFEIGPQQGMATGLPRSGRRRDSGPPTLAWSVIPDQPRPGQPAHRPPRQTRAARPAPRSRASHRHAADAGPHGIPAPPPSHRRRRPVPPPSGPPPRATPPDELTVVNAGCRPHTARRLTVVPTGCDAARRVHRDRRQVGRRVEPRDAGW